MDGMYAQQLLTVEEINKYLDNAIKFWMQERAESEDEMPDYYLTVFQSVKSFVPFSRNALLKYIDGAIQFWGTNQIIKSARYCVDAFQSVRYTIFGQELK